MTTLTLLEGGKARTRQFACTVCGASFDRRSVNDDGAMSLEEHWATTPLCSDRRFSTGTPQRFPGPVNELVSEFDEGGTE